MRLRAEFKKITILFLIWKIYLVGVMLLALNFVPLGYKDKFLGGGFLNYSKIPQILSWANFDGEHYLSISIFGYKGLEQAFFPVYPKTIAYIADKFFPSWQGSIQTDLFSSLLTKSLVGLFVSNLAILISLVLLWDLIKIDYSEKVAFWTVVSVLAFPLSFYFGAVYSESLFLLLAISSFYFARRGNWFLASVAGGISSATRIFGLVLFPALLIESWKQKNSTRQKLSLLIIPIGLFIYMYYQWITAGDPFAFYKLQKIVGEQHQSGITLLPQVFYRYIKMLLMVDINSPIYQTLVLEFVTGIIFFLLPIYGFFKKIRLSYLCFAMISFLMPSIQGSLSSVPRYMIVFFPSFIALATLLANTPRWMRIILILLSIVWLGIETALFLRAYWIA